MKYILALATFAFFVILPVGLIADAFQVVKTDRYALNAVGMSLALFVIVTGLWGINRLTKAMPPCFMRAVMTFVLLMIPSITIYWILEIVKDAVVNMNRLMMFIVVCHAIGAMLYVVTEAFWEEFKNEKLRKALRK